MTMVERVARALMEIEGLDPNGFEGPIMDESGRNMWRDRARVVIKAMREPTADMKIAGMYASAYRFDSTPEWQAMIDAALAEK
jgi:hypothetical protein